jgi:hypothetical protein
MTPTLKAARERVEREIAIDGISGCRTSANTADLRTILAALDEHEWRPIETAPRDGAIILIAVNVRGDGSKVYEARWNEISECFSGRNGFLLFDGAHAWRPLPAPPVEVKG